MLGSRIRFPLPRTATTVDFGEDCQVVQSTLLPPISTSSPLRSTPVKKVRIPESRAMHPPWRSGSGGSTNVGMTGYQQPPLTTICTSLEITVSPSYWIGMSRRPGMESSGLPLLASVICASDESPECVALLLHWKEPILARPTEHQLFFCLEGLQLSAGPLNLGHVHILCSFERADHLLPVHDVHLALVLVVELPALACMVSRRGGP
jgi:hypothetical protein